MSISLQILLLVALVILVAKLAAELSARLGLPLVLGELLAGVLLGPTLLDIWSLSWFTHTVSPASASAPGVFHALAQVGVVLLMFLAGLETDRELMRDAAASAFWAAAGGVLLPMAGGTLLARHFGLAWPEAIFIGTILTATSVTISAQTLLNLNKLRSKEGSTILGAAVIDDVMGLIVLSAVVAIVPRMASGEAVSWKAFMIPLGKMAACLVIILWWGPPVCRWLLKRAAKLQGNHTEAAAALVLAFLLAFQAEWLGGMASITGAYLAGLFIGNTPARDRIVKDLHPLIYSFFGPIFFVSIGLEVNTRNLAGGFGFFATLLAVAIVGKIAGSGLGSRLTGFTNREALVVGVGMIPRGEVGLITASIGLAAGLVTQGVYIQSVVLVLVTTIVTPPLLWLALRRQAEPGLTEPAELVPLDRPAVAAPDLGRLAASGGGGS